MSAWKNGFVAVAWTALVCCALAVVSGCPNTNGNNGQDTTDANFPDGTDEHNDNNGVTPGTGGEVPAGGVIADHTAAVAFDDIPAAAIAAAQAAFRIFYGHTSHGSQIVTGLEMLQVEDARYAFNTGADTLTLTEESGDLGENGDLAWVDVTRNVLDAPGNNINLVAWSWCGGVSGNTTEGIDAYLTAMDALEADYPDVVFIYMTGHLDGTGPTENLYARNNQIRAWCAAHGKALFDFADIESYDPAGNYYPDGSDWCEWCTTWCEAHTCPTCIECAHSQCMNCYQKGRAFWWLLARLAGWNG